MLKMLYLSTRRHQFHNNYPVSSFSSPLWQRFPRGQFRFKWGEKNTHRKQSQEEKCEPLALVTAQSDKLPK